MESEDLADLLERELALLDDADDTDDENTYKEDFLKNRTNDEFNDETIDEDLNQLLLSAQTLPNLRNVDEAAPPEVEACREDCEEQTVLNPTDESSANYPTEHTQSSVVTELTEEEKKIITDLMELMIESVERVAPILERTELRPLQTTPSTLTLVETPVLTIISDDEQLTQHLPALEMPAENNDRKVEIDLINHQLQNEARLEREARITSLQHSDQVVWDETNQFKQAIEKEKLKREERQRKRELAKLEARREKAAENIQRVLRGYLTRRTFSQLQQQHRIAKQQTEAEQALRLKRQEEALREQQRLLDNKNQALECIKMGENEAQCRKIWEEIHLFQGKQRAQELRHMCIEDERSAQVRLVIQQARLKIESFALLAAQEDVEYDLFDESDADMSETESIIDGEEEVTTPEPGLHQSNIQNGQSRTSAHSNVSTPTPTPAATVSNATAPTTSTTKPIYKVVPPKAKPTASVDPRQGRKFGGALINTSVSCSTSSGENVSNSDNTASSAVDPTTNATNGVLLAQNNMIQKPSMSTADRQALESQWQQLVANSYKFTSRSVSYDTAGVTLAQSMLNSCFAQENTVSKVERQCVNKDDTCALISAMHYWQQWYIDYPSSIPTLTTSATLSTATNTTTEPISTLAEDAEVPHNTMLDTHADPLLLTELECSVEFQVLHSYKSTPTWPSSH